MARLCPECGEEINLRATSCNACGWTTVPPRADGLGSMQLKIGNETVDLQCKWESIDGQRCPLKGWVSSGTTGHGPWYCGPHFWRLNGESTKREAPDQPRTLREFIK